MPILDQKIVDDFKQDGAVLLKGFFSDNVNSLAQAIEENMAAPSWRERTYKPDDDSAAFFQDYVVWDKFDGYRQLVRDSKMAQIATELMGSTKAQIFHDHILVKEPGTSVATPWHQDHPYYVVDAPKSVSFWVPVDPVPRDRTIEFVSGSHLWGQDFRAMRFDGTPLFENDDASNVPTEDELKKNFDVIGWAVEPGDAVAFNFKTLHGAPANKSDIRRRVVSIRWVGDDAVFAPDRGKTSPHFPDLDVKSGSSFVGEEFPVIFERT